MTLLLSIAVGVVFACGLYLVLRRSLAQLVVGLALLSAAVNLGVFTAGGLVRGAPPLVAPGESAPPPGVADPLPQALVLTAIVIGFALIAFVAVLVWRTRELAESDDVDQLRSTDT